MARIAKDWMIRVLVQKILENPHGYEWSLQGFGMLRTYLAGVGRLNLWHSTFRVENVSLIHTHPWHFARYIVCGELTNIRYQEFAGDTHRRGVIKPGPGGGLLSSGVPVDLLQVQEEVLTAGEIYYQQADEIHKSLPTDGTITLNHRTRVGNDRAFVYWEAGSEWVSAEPRKAMFDEIEVFVSAAKQALQD